MNVMKFYDPSSKVVHTFTACQSKTGMWFSNRPSPEKIQKAAAKRGWIPINAKNRSNLLAAVST